MAEVKEVTKKDSAKGKDTATRKGLTIDQLKAMGKKGSLVLLARLAFAIGSDPKNKFKGTEWADRDAKKVAGTFYQKVGPKGAVLTVDENSDEIKASVAAAKLAQKDISEQKWSQNTQKFFDSIISITVGGTGVRTRNYGIAADLKF